MVADDSVAASFSQALDDAQPEVKDALMTLAEKWKAEGEAKGEAKGRAEGKAEGKAETLRKLLTLRFGDLTEATARRIASASEADLDRWVERVLTADTLDAVIGV